MRLLNSTNELGIILPAGLISGERWAQLREQLFNRFNFRKIIQLPTNSFKNTDAQTFIATIDKRCESSNKIELSHILHEKIISVGRHDAVNRADYNFYQGLITEKKPEPISEEYFSIFWGKTPHLDLRDSAKHYIHTSQLPKTPSELNLPQYEFKIPTTQYREIYC